LGIEARTIKSNILKHVNFFYNFQWELFVKNLLLLFCLTSFLLTGCASNDVKDYPLYNEHVAKVMESHEAQTNSLIDSEVPNLSKVPVYTAPGNVFTMSHPNDNKLSGKFRADFNGVLQLPYNISINVTNKTFSELRDSVLSSYRKFFQKGVEDVKFTQTGKEIWVEVRGLVKKPGRYLVRPSDSLDLVVDAAGGVQGDISVDYFSATLKQSKYEYQVLLNKYFEASGSAEKIRWLGGDSVFISKLDGLAGISKDAPFVTLIGGVTKPGKVLHQKDASLYYYIEKSGGLLQGLGYNECYVFRNTKEGVKRINFSFDKPETIPMIYPNDTVYMNSKVLTTGDEWLNRFAQIAGIISTAALLIIAL
jgi:protein involved in polysaccharide export with SLBB domain